MKPKSNGISLFFLEANAMVISTLKKPQPQTVAFPAGVIEHMEVINYDKLYELIASVCASLQLQDTLAILVVGKTLSFEKQVPPLPEDKLDEQLISFKEITPFERAAAHAYKNTQGSLFISINRDFYDTFRQILERNNVKVVGILPQFVSSELLGSGAIQAKTLNQLESKLDLIADRSIIAHKMLPKTLQEKQEYISKQYSGAVIAVFALFLVAVIGGTGMILRSQFQTVRKQTPTPAPATAVTVPTSSPAIETPETVDEVKTATPSSLLVAIVYGTQSASPAAKLQKEFQASAYTQTSIQKLAGVQTENPLIVFKPSVPEGNRQYIIKTVRELFPTIAVQDATDLDVDVRVTLGK